MPVYMVYVCHSVSDRSQLEKYWAAIAPTLKGHSVKYLAAYTPFEVLEGEENLEPPNALETGALKAFSGRSWYDGKVIRLACQTRVRGNVTVRKPGVRPVS